MIKSNLLLRTLSGIVLVAILVGGVLLSPQTRFFVLVAIALGTLNEMLNLFRRSEVNVKCLNLYTIATSLTILLSSQFLPELTIGITLTALIVRAIIELYRKQDRPFDSLGYELFALVYTTVPIMLLNEFTEPYMILLVFIIVWTNDVGAYIVGSLMGKHKLFERISPKKSWEGLWGGLILSVVVSALLGHYWFNEDFILFGIIGLITSIAAVYGDLFESLFKRAAKIKDSGKIIPGHGGFWDRFDALFLAAPAFYVAYKILDNFFFFKNFYFNFNF